MHRWIYYVKKHRPTQKTVTMPARRACDKDRPNANNAAASSTKMLHTGNWVSRQAGMRYFIFMKWRKRLEKITSLTSEWLDNKSICFQRLIFFRWKAQQCNRVELRFNCLCHFSCTQDTPKSISGQNLLDKHLRRLSLDSWGTSLSHSRKLRQDDKYPAGLRQILRG